MSVADDTGCVVFTLKFQRISRGSFGADQPSGVVTWRLIASSYACRRTMISKSMVIRAPVRPCSRGSPN